MIITILRWSIVVLFIAGLVATIFYTIYKDYPDATEEDKKSSALDRKLLKINMENFATVLGSLVVLIVLGSPIAAFIGFFFGFVPVGLGWRDWLEEDTFIKCAIDGYIMIGIFLVLLLITALFSSNKTKK